VISPVARRLPSLSSDVVLVVAVAALGQFEVWAPGWNLGNMVGPRPAVSLVYLLCAGALFWRRRAPLAVLVFASTLSSFEYVVFGAPEGLGTFLPPLVALYSVGRYADPARVLVAVPVALVGTALHEVRDPEFRFGGSTVIFWVILAAGWPLGYAFRLRDRDVQTLAARTVELEQGREERARQAAAAERARIARELHDVVGHGVSVVVLQLVAALGLLDKGDLVGTRQRLLQTELSARQALDEMRRLVGLLDGDDLGSLEPQPGLGRVDELVANVRAAGIPVEVILEGEPVELPPGPALAAYRIIQESLTNVLKHAGPTTATLVLRYARDSLQIEVVDNGVGGRPAEDGGRGIPGIRERVSLYGGQVEIGPRPEGGFRVRAQLPRQEAPA
jgi:signal transduction histidine kinase